MTNYIAFIHFQVFSVWKLVDSLKKRSIKCGLYKTYFLYILKVEKWNV